MNAQATKNWLEHESSPVDTARVHMWDGRLDNRSDLLLILKDHLRIDSDDAALALAAYKRWGTDGFGRLIGDWSVVISDSANRSTVLASDFAGVRPLYYAVQSGRALWSSHLKSLVVKTGISDLDEQYAAAFLMYGGCPHRTPYKGIQSVPPGHAVCVSAIATKILPFWTLPVHDEIRYQSNQHYQEQFRSLFREAVSVRLQGKSPVLAELSGGLDSSSVVSMANNLMGNGDVPARSLSSVSYVWPNSMDTPFIQEIESFCGIEGVHISMQDAPLMRESEVGDVQPQILQPWRNSLAALTGRLKAKTLLTGQNGDLVTGNWFDDSLQVSASLRRLHLKQACREAFEWSKILRRPVYDVLLEAASAALPSSLAPAHIYARTDGSYILKSSETSFAPGLVDRFGLSEPDALFSSRWLQAPPERRKYFRSLSTLIELRQLQTPEALQHLDYTHPFAHRPLVEFLMTVPTSVLCGPGEPRRLMRSALSDLWPVKLRNRRSKGLFAEPWQDSLRTLAGVLIKAKKLHLVERGFLDRDSVHLRLRRAVAGLDCNRAQLLHIVLLELWLRNRQGVAC